MIFGAILAGGTGSRMNIENMPKQFLLLGSKPVFIHTVEKFLMSARIDMVYLGVHPQWTAYAEKELQKYGITQRVQVIPGGADRNSTIINIVEYIRNQHGISAEHVIVTHDAVRPFVGLETIDANIDAAIKYGACDTVIPAVDTIVRSEDSEVISEIPVRNQMYQGQTPQSFNLEKFYAAYLKLNTAQLASLTDACKVMLLQGQPVGMVKGDVSNIKLTTIMDYKIAQAMLSLDTDH